MDTQKIMKKRDKKDKKKKHKKREASDVEELPPVTTQHKKHADSDDEMQAASEPKHEPIIGSESDEGEHDQRDNV